MYAYLRLETKTPAHLCESDWNYGLEEITGVVDSGSLS